MKVELVYYPFCESENPWAAAALLAFTKSTRLNMTPEGFVSFMAKSPEELDKEMAYMATSIPSSWEFVDLIFTVEGISRATAQQITRTRHGTFAMQSQRVTDLSGVTFEEHPGAPGISMESLGFNRTVLFEECMQGAIENYSDLVKAGMPLEDARDLLPIGVHCNLVAKYNLRTLVELVRGRERSLRVQGPYQEYVRLMREAVEAVWPWSKYFFADPNAKAREMLAEVAKELQSEAGAMATGQAGKIAKALDLLGK